MQGWSIEYELVDKLVSPKSVFRRTATFTRSKWSRDSNMRRVIFFGVSRTVPAHERKDLFKCATGKFEVPESQIESFSANAARSISRVLGKDVAKFRRLRLSQDGRTTLLTGTTKENDTYSEFHFGAGESSVIRMVLAIESAEPNTLVLVEEIENGLHPVATVRMVEYLISVALRKSIQTIFTTHSNDALKPLPSKAIWVATQDRIFQGKLDIQSLRAITGQVEAKLVLFVEDKFAAEWVQAMLRNYGNVALDHVQIHPMQGDGTAVQINRHHRADPSSTMPSVCIIDGDSEQHESSEGKVFRLPGGAPESYVFDAVLDRWSEYGGILTAALLQRFEATEQVRRICEDVRCSNMDLHLIYAQVGKRLGLIPGETVARAFVNIYSQSHPDDVRLLMAGFVDLVPFEKASENAE